MKNTHIDIVSILKHKQVYFKADYIRMVMGKFIPRLLFEIKDLYFSYS